MPHKSKILMSQVNRMTGSLVSLLDRFVNTGQVHTPLNVLIVEKVREKGRNSQGFGSKGMVVVSKEDP